MSRSEAPNCPGCGNRAVFEHGHWFCHDCVLVLSVDFDGSAVWER